MKERIKIFTWNIDSNYLFSLSQGDIEIYIPINEQRTEGYAGSGNEFQFGINVHEVPAEEVRGLSFDCIMFQTPKNYLFDQFEILSVDLQNLPRIYLEHDPPQGTPTDTLHVVNDPNVTVVHVTHFNNLMWDCNRTPTAVIEHGIISSNVNYAGELQKGIVAIDNLNQSARRLGLDIFLKIREHVPLDLIGIGTEKFGGKGEILHSQLPEFLKRYRFFFNPIRYSSLELQALEAMMIGIPVVGMATAEMVTVIQNGFSGVIHTDLDYLNSKMDELLDNKALAVRLGEEGKKIVMERFNIERFAKDWHRRLTNVIAEKKLAVA